MKSVSFFFILVLGVAAQLADAQKSGQSTAGNCSPNISNTGTGNVTVEFVGGSCQGIDPLAVKKLNNFLGEFPEEKKRLLELLNRKDADLADLKVKVNQIAELTVKYEESTNQLKAIGKPDHIAKMIQMNEISAKDRQQMDATIRKLDEVLAKTNFKTTPENLVLLGLYCIGQAQYDRAIAFLLDATQRNPSLGSAYQGLATAFQLKGYEYLQRRDIDHAAEALDKSEGYAKISEQYEDFEASSMVQLGYTERDLAQAYSQKGMEKEAAAEEEKAARHFNMAIGADSKDAGAHNGLGNIYFDRGDLDGAIRECQTAVSIEPKYTFAWFDLVLVLKQKYGSDGQTKEQNRETLRALVTALTNVVQLTQDSNAQQLPETNVKYILDLVQWATGEARKYRESSTAANFNPTAGDADSHFQVSGVGTAKQLQAITSALVQYYGYLRGLGVTIPAGPAKVHVTPANDLYQSSTDYLSFYDPSSDTIFFKVQYADNTFWPLRDYTFRVLNEAKALQRPALIAILSGLATYYPSSSTNNPNYGQDFAAQLDQFRSLDGMQNLQVQNASTEGSARWGSTFWELRSLLNREAADALLLQAWQQMLSANTDQPDSIAFASRIIDLHKAAGGDKGDAIRQLFQRRGLKL